jgi:16S rRNA (adenine1518-N6/adenine1519-N6)-dimethyltransferase
MQALCEVEIVRIMPPDVFWPRPKVESAIIHIEPKEEKRALFPDLGYFHKFVRSLFFHRRKFLRSVLVAAYKDRLEKSDIDAVMAAHSFGPTTRAEELDVPTISALCETCRTAEQAKGTLPAAAQETGELS